LDTANAITSGGNTVMNALMSLAKRIDGLSIGGTKGVVTGGQLPANPQSGGVGGAKGFVASGGLLKGKFVEAW
ncbi:MAG: hypothetical protein KGL39_54215, partial [Patescibacteria group bacterium]|nr:hypothetical protein [Patescibacteria group bacterium]